jgi:hypothetical protein
MNARHGHESKVTIVTSWAGEHTIALPHTASREQTGGNECSRCCVGNIREDLVHMKLIRLLIKRRAMLVARADRRRWKYI